MKRNYLQAAVVGGLLCLSGSVLADSIQVPFAGTIAATCGVIVANDGILGEGAVPSQLKSVTQGRVDVTCSGDGTVAVADPVSVGVALGGAIHSKAFRAVAPMTTANSPSHPSGVATLSITGTVQVDVIMEDNTADSSPVPPGDYEYTVTVTVTPS